MRYFENITRNVVWPELCACVRYIASAWFGRTLSVVNTIRESNASPPSLGLIGEPSGHRWARRLRGSARVLLRLGSAPQLLGAHHSVQQGMPHNGGGGFIKCGCGYKRHWAKNDKCFKCGKALAVSVAPRAIPQGVWGAAGDNGVAGGTRKERRQAIRLEKLAQEVLARRSREPI